MPKPEVKDGKYLALTFEDLASYEYKFPEIGAEAKPTDQIPASVKKYHEREIAIQGFMIPIKTEGEHSSEGTESAELQVLYSRAIDANWDLQVGLRHDAHPEPQRNWAAIGFNGVSPYWFQIDSALFIEEEGQANLRFKADYEIMLSQKWV